MAPTFKKLAYLTDCITTANFAAKGDLIAGKGAATFGTLTVGSNALALVADSTQTTGLKWAAPTPAAHAASHMDDASDELLLSDLGEPTALVDFSGQQAKDLCLDNEAADPTGVLGKVYFKTGDTGVYVCTAIS